jgi:hypothetical protein
MKRLINLIFNSKGLIIFRANLKQTAFMKQKFLIILVSMLAVGKMNVAAQTGYVIKDLTTGVYDGTTTPIPYGADDDTWRVIWPAGSGGGLGYKPTKVAANLGGAWATADCGRWISHQVDAGTNNPIYGGVAGTYGYQTHFELNTSCLIWVKITFTKLGADNRARNFKVNGHPYTIGPLAWAATDWYNPLKENITINIDPAHLVNGTNVLDIEVTNNEAYQGLFICGNISKNYCP